MSSKSVEMDMTTGNLCPKIIKFAIPLIFTGILQLLFNAADLIIVGQFAPNPDFSVSAVGSTSSLVNLIVNVFMGLSVGANVLMAKAFGSKDKELADRTLQTSVLLSLICGVIVGLFGFSFASIFLGWMGTPDNVIGLASVYLKIFFLGMPFNLLYNYGAAILRSLGDTKRPLYYLFIAGFINVIGNIIFVAIFKMDVKGVAISTVISQFVSSLLILIALIRGNSFIKLNLKHIRLYKEETIQLIKIGVPAGIEGSVFSISNVIIQSSINSFGEVSLAGNTAASNIEGFVYQAMAAIHYAALAFTAQNVGAKNFQNIRKTLIYSIIITTIIGLVLGGLVIAFAPFLINIYVHSPDSIAVGVTRLKFIVIPYFTCGIMDVLCGVIRGLGFSIAPTVISFTGACLFRIIWVFTIFKAMPSLEILYISYPITWILTSLIYIIFYFAIRKSVQYKMIR